MTNETEAPVENGNLSPYQPRHKWFWLLLSLYLCLATAYNIASPLFEAPDEHHHYFVVHHLALTRQLPVASPETLARQEAAQPPLYYVVGALLLTPFDVQATSIPLWQNPYIQFESATIVQNANAFVHTQQEAWPWSMGVWTVHWLRFYSTLLGAGTLILIYVSARLLWPYSVQRPLLAMSLVAFWPQFLFIHSSVSNDSLITFLSTAVLGQLLWLQSRGVTNRRLLLLGVTIGLAILSKMTGLLLLPLALVVVAGQLWDKRRSGHLLAGLVMITGPVVAVSGWLFWRNWVLYGDVTAVNQFIALAGGERPYTLRQVWHDMGRVWPSLFAFFGWMTVRPPAWVQAVWNGLMLLACGGGLWSLTRTIKEKNLSASSLSWSRLWQPGFWLSGWCLLVVAAWLRFMLQTPADQGRLWFPAILPLSLGLAYGLTQFRWRGWAMGASGLALLTAVAGILTIRQAYALPPVLDSVAFIPDRTTRLDAVWGDGLVLLAVMPEQETAVPGEWVWLTLYWQADVVPEEAPIVELHALGRGYVLVGQTKTYHGGGHYPANLWSAGEIIADRIGVRLNPLMQTPTQVRLMLMSPTDAAPLALGEVTVPTTSPVPLDNAPLAQVDEGLILRQAETTATVVAPGETITVTLGWQVVVAPQRPLTAFVHLGEATQPPLAQMDAPPLAADYPPLRWQAGDFITDTFTLTIPPDLANGRYPLQTGFYDSETAVRLPLLVNNNRQPHDAYFIDWITVQAAP